MPLGARLARFWGAPMPPVTSRKRPRAPRERPNDVPERPRSLSGASPERLGSAPRRARALQGGPGASRGRIGVHFGGQIGHKRCIFRCFSHLCLQTSEHAAHSYRACLLHSFQSFFGHGVWITAKNPCWHSLAAFHDHPAARRYVRSTWNWSQVGSFGSKKLSRVGPGAF